MNPELLEKILQMVGTAGEGSFALAVIYMLIPLLITMLWLLLIAFVVNKVAANVTANLFANRIAEVVVPNEEIDLAAQSSRERLLQEVKTLKDHYDNRGGE